MRGGAAGRRLAASFRLGMVLAASLPLAAGVAGPLRARARAQLARILVCPERLADDDARRRNTDRFIALYARFAPASRVGERMSLRARLLAEKGCDPARDDLIHTVPEV